MRDKDSPVNGGLGVRCLVWGEREGVRVVSNNFGQDGPMSKRATKAMPELMILIKGMVAAMRSVFFTLALLVILCLE